jgi:uncharacterized protein DUF3105
MNAAGAPSLRPSLRSMLWILAVVLVGLLLVQAVVLSMATGDRTVWGERMPDRGSEWLPYGTPIHYIDQPPATGPMWLSNADAGVYPQGLPPGYWLHSLHQGYIVLLYRPPVTKVTEWIFQLMVWTFPRGRFGIVKLVVAPYTDMPHPFAVVAWSWRLWMDHLDIAKVLAFYRVHVDRGPEPIP